MAKHHVEIDEYSLEHFGHELCMGIRHSLFGSGDPDRNIERVFGETSDSISQLAVAITPSHADIVDGENGVKVGCLTEAVLDASAGLARIASAIESLADAVSSLKPRTADPMDMLGEELRQELDKD